MKKYYAAILGFGTVGTGVYRILSENSGDIIHREHISIDVRHILIKGFDCEPNLEMAPKELFTLSLDDIVSDDDVSIVIECMGGVEPARCFILKCLSAGKTVVTSNKEVISKHWYEFEEAAKNSGAGLYYEATVGGGIPILRTITDSMQANNITRVMGIINGTTNYILTKMSEEGREFDDVLHEAQKLGYAEADPTADIEGFDATYKLSILSSMAFHAHLPVDVIHREGITQLTKADFIAAKMLGYEIKLLAIGKKNGNHIEVRVHPTMVAKDHPLASVRGVFNAIFLTGHAVDDVMLYGRGAGRMPTASAVVSDVIYACHHEGRHRYMTFKNGPSLSDEIDLNKNFSCIYCIRIAVKDNPGTMARICECFANHDVSLKDVLQLGATFGSSENITFMTHVANEFDVMAALDDIRSLDCVSSIESVIRAEN